jgi:hypothetical protein
MNVPRFRIFAGFDLELSIVHVILSLVTELDWRGGIVICIWYMKMLIISHISHYSITTLITKLCPCHSKFSN